MLTPKPLTREEKEVGRRFRDEAEQALRETFHADPPTYTVLNCLALLRHLCPARAGRSTALELKEIYLYSPRYPGFEVPAGRFGYLYRQGRCRACGQTARSGGRLVDAHDRPPLPAARSRRSPPVGGTDNSSTAPPEGAVTDGEPPHHHQR